MRAGAIHHGRRPPPRAEPVTRRLRSRRGPGSIRGGGHGGARSRVHSATFTPARAEIIVPCVRSVAVLTEFRAGTRKRVYLWTVV